MSNAISFCLFGSEAMYLRGAVRNVELAAKIYPGWKCWFYIGDGVPDSVTQELVKLGANISDCQVKNPMLSRFLIHDQPGVSRYLVRDCDSRLNERERSAVEEWIASTKAFHVIRDHSGHKTEMPGGLWGGTPGTFSMRKLINVWNGNKAAGHRNSIYNNDQVFLREQVWPIIKGQCLQHDFCCQDVYHGTTRFPAKFGDWRFVGEIFDHNDVPERYGWQKRMNFLEP